MEICFNTQDASIREFVRRLQLDKALRKSPDACLEHSEIDAMDFTPSSETPTRLNPKLFWALELLADSHATAKGLKGFFEANLVAPQRIRLSPAAAALGIKALDQFEYAISSKQGSSFEVFLNVTSRSVAAKDIKSLSYFLGYGVLDLPVPAFQSSVKSGVAPTTYPLWIAGLPFAIQFPRLLQNHFFQPAHMPPAFLRDLLPATLAVVPYDRPVEKPGQRTQPQLDKQGFGTATMISGSGDMLVSKHIFTDAKGNIRDLSRLTLFLVSSRHSKAIEIAMDNTPHYLFPEHDLAWLRVEALRGHPYLPISDRKPQTGEVVYAAGQVSDAYQYVSDAPEILEMLQKANPTTKVEPGLSSLTGVTLVAPAVVEPWEDSGANPASSADGQRSGIPPSTRGKDLFQISSYLPNGFSGGPIVFFNEAEKRVELLGINESYRARIEILDLSDQLAGLSMESAQAAGGLGVDLSGLKEQLDNSISLLDELPKIAKQVLGVAGRAWGAVKYFFGIA